MQYIIRSQVGNTLRRLRNYFITALKVLSTHYVGRYLCLSRIGNNNIIIYRLVRTTAPAITAHYFSHRSVRIDFLFSKPVGVMRF